MKRTIPVFVLPVLLPLAGCISNGNEDLTPDRQWTEPPTGLGTYGDLLTLFDDFIAFMKPIETDGIADYSDNLVEQKIVLMQQFWRWEPLN